jgi:hypothetical protein
MKLGDYGKWSEARTNEYVEILDKCAKTANNADDFVACVVNEIQKEYSVVLPRRIDWIGNQNMILKFFREAPNWKPYSPSALSEMLDLDPKTAKEHLEESVGKDANGTIARTTSDGEELFYKNPDACGTLTEAGYKAKEEGNLELADEIISVQERHCQ